MGLALILSCVCISEIYSQTYSPIYATRIELKNGVNKTIINPNGSGGLRSFSLPVDAPDDGDVLTFHTDGSQLSWDAPTGGGGSLSGGTADYLVKWTGGTTVGLSSITDASGLVSTGSNLALTGANKTLTFTGNSTGKTTFAAGNQGTTNITYTLPTDDGDSANVLMSNGSGVMSWKQQPVAVFGGNSKGATTNNEFLSLYGNFEFGSGAENDAEILIPRAGVIKNFRVYLTQTPNAATSKTFTVRKNGANTAVTVTIPNGSQTASDLTNTLTVAAGDRVCIKITHTGSPGTANAVYGLEMY